MITMSCFLTESILYNTHKHFDDIVWALKPDPLSVFLLLLSPALV